MPQTTEGVGLKEASKMKPGNKVTIWNHNLGGKLIVEGQAVLIRKSKQDIDGDWWVVRFDGDGPTENYLREITQPIAGAAKC